MTRLITCAVVVGFISSVALGETPKKHLLINETEQRAETRCDSDTVVWASAESHRLYLPGDQHNGHTRAGYACESKARAAGYHGHF